MLVTVASELRMVIVMSVLKIGVMKMKVCANYDQIDKLKYSENTVRGEARKIYTNV